MTNKKNRSSLVSLYLTPLALILVLMSIIFSKPMGSSLYISFALLLVSLINNILLPYFAGSKQGIKTLRMIVNVSVNTLLVFILLSYWGPIWYLFLLTPLATAVYYSRKKTLYVSISMSALLCMIYWLKGVRSFEHWGQVSANIVLIIFLSIFINSIVGDKKSKEDA